MKKYTDEELADLVNQKIKAKFNSPESIIAEFESKLNGKVNLSILHKTKLLKIKYFSDL